MKLFSCLRHRRGFLLLEALLGIALFSLFLGAAGLTLLRGQESTETAGDRVRGTEYAQQMLEAARSIRDQNFALLTPGVHGARINGTTGKWELYSTQATFGSGFTSTLTITALDARRVLLTAKTSWGRVPNRQQSVTLQGILTNWSASKTVGNWSSLVMSGSYIHGSLIPYTNIAATGNTAYVTTASPTQGLLVFNVTSAASITNAATVNIGAAGVAVAVRGYTLYVLTKQSDAEIKAYDIENPLAPVFLTSYDLPGSGQATTIAADGDYLYVGAVGLSARTSQIAPAGTIAARSFSPFSFLSIPIAEAKTACVHATNDGGTVIEACNCAVYPQDCPDPSSESGALTEGGSTPPAAATSPATPPAAGTGTSSVTSSAAPTGPFPDGDDFFSFDISNPAQISFLDSVYVGGVNELFLYGTGAYLATPLDATELRMVNINDPASLLLAGGVNVTGTTDALAVSKVGTSTLLGLQNNVTQELSLMDIRSAQDTSSFRSPLFYESSGSTVRVSADPTGCYGFLATGWRQQALQIVHLKNASLPRVASYMPTAPDANPGVSLFYDAAKDRLYFLTGRGLYIFTPGAGANNCS